MTNFRWRLQLKWRDLRAAFQSWRQGFRLPTVRHLAPIPPGSNPFHYDAGNMGTPLVREWTVMHPGYDRPEQPMPLGYVILVNGRTGQRILVNNLK